MNHQSVRRKKAAEVVGRLLVGVRPLGDRPNYVSFKTVGSELATGVRLPEPWLVYLSLVELLRFPCYWKLWEKTLWTIPVEYEGARILLEHGKFGLRISALNPDESRDAVSGLIDLLRTAFPTTRRAFSDEAAERIREGAVTVANHFGSYRMKYDYFRKGALAEFDSKPPLPQPVKRPDGSVMAMSYDPIKGERQGYFMASAALDAYFSGLEHVLTLLGPFVGVGYPQDDVLKFCLMNWSTKFKRAFDLDVDSAAHRVYDSLLDLKRSFRNPIAHGGVDREGNFLFVHFTKLGALPAKLERETEVSLFPISERTFAEACRILDQADEFFSVGSCANAYKYIQGGFDVAFDQDSRKRYQEIVEANQDELTYIFDRVAYEQDSWANMDW